MASLLNVSKLRCRDYVHYILVCSTLFGGSLSAVSSPPLHTLLLTLGIHTEVRISTSADVYTITYV